MRSPSRPLLVAVGVAAALFAGCGNDDAGDGAVAPEAADLEGTSWNDASVEGYELAGTLTITFEEGRVSVAGGCNTIGGPYTVEDGLLSAGPMMSTMMACDEALMDQDTWISGLFEAGMEAGIDGDQLTLTADDTSITLTSTG